MGEPSHRRHTIWPLLCVSAVVALVSAVRASEVVTYKYDELGRLKSAVHTGTINNNLNTQLQYDPAGNRTAYAVTGSSGTAPGNGATGGTGGSVGGPPIPPTFPSFAISDASATEGGALVFTVTKSGSGSGSFSVSYASANGTAAAGADYQAVSGTLTFTEAEVTKTVTVSTINDAAVESTETMVVSLSGPTGGSTVTDAQGVGSILDNDTTNTPPTTVNDSVTGVQRCQTRIVNVTANDTDPDGDLPLTVTGASASFDASPSPPASVTFTAPDAAGPFIITYTVTDSRGASANGQLSFTVPTNPACP